jgi:hypothetical protein
MGTTEITATPGQPRIDMQREFAAPRAMIAAGMTSGINEGYERLDELLASQTVTA